MIEMSALAQNLQASANGVIRYVRAESWREGELLADNVPITSGREEGDRTADIPERVTLTVPREYDGFDWSPKGEDHPLSANGQRLRVMLGIGLAGMDVEWIQRGEFLLQESDPEGDDVTVTAVGLLAVIEEARLVAPYQPTGTMKSTVRGLIEPGLTVVFDASLVDRSVPAGINYDENRLSAVQELLAAWPAEIQVTSTGYAYVSAPPTTYTSNVSINSSNIVTSSGKSSREGSYNSVVARGTATDGGQVQATAYVTNGPLRYPGPFSPLPVPEYFASPLLTTVAQCTSAAQTRRNRIMRENGSPYLVEMLPHIGLQVGDVALLTDLDTGEETLTTVEAYSLPYTAGDGAMRTTLVEVV